MKTIGIISDTHSYLDPNIFNYFSDCDEIWHAGDIGDEHVFTELKKFKPTLAVYGNIDNKELQWELPEFLIFEKERIKILMIHIAGTFSSYNKTTRKLIKDFNPDFLVCGHSHILRVKKDLKFNNLLYINPGAAGKQGFHKMRTVLKLVIDNKEISKLELIELGKR